MNPIIVEDDDLLFQFHKVRLKGYVSFIQGQNVQCFNSIRYD